MRNKKEISTFFREKNVETNEDFEIMKLWELFEDWDFFPFERRRFEFCRDKECPISGFGVERVPYSIVGYGNLVFPSP